MVAFPIKVNAILGSLLVACTSALRNAQAHTPQLEGLLNVSTVVTAGAWLDGNQSAAPSRPMGLDENFAGDNQSTTKTACDYLIAEIVRTEQRFNKELHKMWDVLTKLSEQQDVVAEIIRKLGTSVGSARSNLGSGERAWLQIKKWVSNLQFVIATSDTLKYAITTSGTLKHTLDICYLLIVKAVTAVADDLLSWRDYIDPCRDGQNAIQLIYTLPKTSAWLRKEEERWEKDHAAEDKDLEWLRKEEERWEKEHAAKAKGPEETSKKEKEKNERNANNIIAITQNPSQRVARYKMLLNDLAGKMKKCPDMGTVIDAAKKGDNIFKEKNEDLNNYQAPVWEGWNNIKALNEDSKYFERLKLFFKKGPTKKTQQKFTWDDKWYLAKFTVELPRNSDKEQTKKKDLYLCSDAIFLADVSKGPGKGTLYFIPLSEDTNLSLTEGLSYPNREFQVTIQADYDNAPKWTFVEKEDRQTRHPNKLAFVSDVFENIQIVLEALRQPPQQQFLPNMLKPPQTQV